MIPIVSITDLINGIIAAAIAVRLIFMLRPASSRPAVAGDLARGYDGSKQNGLLEFIGFYIFFALLCFGYRHNNSKTVCFHVAILVD